MIKSRRIAHIFIIYILCIGLFSRYIEHFSLWKVMTLIFEGLLFCDGKYRKAFRNSVVNPFFFIFCFCIIASVFVSTSTEFLLGNVLYIIWPLLYVASISSMHSAYDGLIYKALNRCFAPLNIMLIMNYIIITIQCNGTPLFIKSSWLSGNSFYEDLCCGLFGYNGTHEFTCFALFMEIFILLKIREMEKYKVSMSIYLTAMTVWLIYLSTKNDNVAMFVLLPAIIAFFFLCDRYYKNADILKLFSKVLKVAIPSVVLVILIANIPFIKSYLNEYVFTRIKLVLDFNNANYQIGGSNERFAIVYKALSEPYGWLFGKGIGVGDIGGGSYFGFSSFGLSSMGSIIMLSGLLSYISYTMVLSSNFNFLLFRKRKFNSFTIIVILILVLFSSYTIIYSSFVTTIWVALIFTVIGSLNRKSK